jgi:hypothetical protein
MRFLSLLLVAACASSNASRAPGAGSIAIKSVANASAPPVTYSVGNGVVSGSNLDLRLDQGCIRGTLRKEPIQLCSDPANPNHWVGASGDFTAVASPDGKSVKVDGYLLVDTLRELDITQIIPVENGPGWDEMRKQPALLALATTAADLSALRGRHRP